MRVLILGTCRQPHTWLMKAGHEVVLFLTKDKVTPADVKGDYAQIFVLNKDAKDDYVGLAEHLHRVRPFDVVCAFNDIWMFLANRIAEKLGLPPAVAPEVLELSANKSKMRDRLAEAGIEATGYRLVESKEQVAQALHDIGPTCILKPVDGESSSGVAKLSGVGDIDQSLQWFRLSGHHFPALVESFLTGDEYSVEGISEAGKHHILAITRKYKDAKTFVEKGHVVPAPLPDDVAQEIRLHVTRVLTVLGFTSGPSHTEVILTAAGPRIVETHTRVGGDRIIDLVRLTTGVDVYELVARQAIGESIAARLPASVTYEGAAAIWYACPSVTPELVLARVEGEEAVRATSWIDTVHLAKPPGECGGPVLNSFDRTALVIATGKDAEEALDRARDGVQKLQFHYRWQPSDQPGS